MNRKYIKDGQLVHHIERGAYGLGIIRNVRKADRGDNKELKYDLEYLIGDKIYKDIHEHSGMTNEFLKIITKEDANNMLLSREYDLDIKIGEKNKDKINVVKGKVKLNSL